MSRTVLVTGATGKTGGAAVVASIPTGTQGTRDVRAEDDRSAALQKPGPVVVTGDLNEIDTMRQALAGVAAAYFVYPVDPGLIDAAVRFAQAAKEAGVGAVVNLSQKSANRGSRSDSCRDNWIAEQVLYWSGARVTHLRPTYFLEWLLYSWQLALLRRGILRLPVGKGRHAPIAAADQGRVIAAVLEDHVSHAGQTYPLFGTTEMNHEEMAAELSVVLNRTIIFENIAIYAYCEWVASLGVSAYRMQHFSGAMDDYQHGAMAGMNDNVERLSGRKPMSVTEFALAHSAELNPSAIRQ